MTVLSLNTVSDVVHEHNWWICLRWCLILRMYIHS